MTKELTFLVIIDDSKEKTMAEWRQPISGDEMRQFDASDAAHVRALKSKGRSGLWAERPLGMSSGVQYEKLY